MLLVDSGAILNILDESSYNLIDSAPPLESTNVKIFPYQATTPLKIQGTFRAIIKNEQNQTTATFYVTTSKSGNLLPKTTAELLNLLRVGPPAADLSTINYETIPVSTKRILRHHKSVFEGSGLLKDFRLQLHIDKSVTPVQQPIRRVPYHTKCKVENELNRLLKLSLIEPVNGPTSWSNPFVPVPKLDGSIRLCQDMRQANKVIVRERHIIAKLEDILPELHGACVFSKIDLREGYHQIMLHENTLTKRLVRFYRYIVVI